MSTTAAPVEEKTRRGLYPEIAAFHTGFLKVSDIHTIYYEISGKKGGKKALVLHGGPGGGSSPMYRQFFDPDVYEIIQFDQRGSGQSTPAASLEENTTWDLVNDIEKLRQHLQIEKWLVFGGSWGSTLSIAYAQEHPERVVALVLRGIFLLREKELRWFYQEGASFVYPDAWAKYLEPIPESERHNLMLAYHRRLTSPDEETRVKAATAWSVWEMSTARLYTDPALIKKAEGDGKFALQFARIENHYFANAGFFPRDGFLLEDDRMKKIENIPCVIVQGRYDMVCPAYTAFDFHAKNKKAEFHLISDAGHSAKEPGIIDALCNGTDKFRELEW